MFLAWTNSASYLGQVMGSMKSRVRIFTRGRLGYLTKDFKTIVKWKSLTSWQKSDLATDKTYQLNIGAIVSMKIFSLYWYLVLMFLRLWEMLAWLFLIRWPSSQMTRSGPGLTRLPVIPKRSNVLGSIHQYNKVFWHVSKDLLTAISRERCLTSVCMSVCLLTRKLLNVLA